MKNVADHQKMTNKKVDFDELLNQDFKENGKVTHNPNNLEFGHLKNIEGNS